MRRMDSERYCSPIASQYKRETPNTFGSYLKPSLNSLDLVICGIVGYNVELEVSEGFQYGCISKWNI